MQTAVRSYTKFSAGLLAAGVVAAAAPVVTVPAGDAVPALSQAAVRPASAITDVLYNFGDVVTAGTNATVISADMLVSLPFEPVLAAAAAVGDPELIGSLFSYLTQLYLNPSDLALSILYTYPADFRFYVLETLAYALLPAPWNQDVADALNDLADGIGGAFSGLPDPVPGEAAVWAFRNDNVIGNLLSAAQYGITAPVYSVANAVSWLGYVPAELEATLESAIGDPSEIPGLLSYLVYSVLDPYYGLLGNVVLPFVDAGSWLPEPLGSAVVDGYDAFGDALTSVLDAVLPTPITPTPFPSMLAGPTATAATVASTEQASLAAAEEPNTITLDVPADPAPTDAVVLQQDSQEEAEAVSDVPEVADESTDPQPPSDVEEKSAPPAAAEADGPKGGPDSDAGSAQGSGKDKTLPKDVKKALDRASVGKSDAAEKAAKTRNAKSDSADSGGPSAGATDNSAKSDGGDSGGSDGGDSAGTD